MSDEIDNKSTSGFAGVEMTLGDHLAELRIRVIYSLIALALAAGLCLFFGWDIITFLVVPLAVALKVNSLPPNLLATSLAGPFMTYMKVSLIAGLFLASPYIFWQFWRFVSAGLRQKEKRLVKFFAPFSAILFILGGAFFIYIVAPLSINFFLNFNSSLSVDPQTGGWFYDILAYQTEPSTSPSTTGPASTQPATIATLCSLNEYISFMLNMSLAFGLSFQLPLLVFLLAKLNIVTLAVFGRLRRYVFFIIIVFAAIITPPDVFSQLALAVPMYGLYELGIVLLKIFR